MFMSRYALTAFAIAVLSLFGMSMTENGITRSPAAPGMATSLSAPNAVHVQVIREASSSYAMKSNAETKSCHPGTAPTEGSDPAARRRDCGNR
jgi:hypothetical protein